VERDARGRPVPAIDHMTGLSSERTAIGDSFTGITRKDPSHPLETILAANVDRSKCTLQTGVYAYTCAPGAGMTGPNCNTTGPEPDIWDCSAGITWDIQASFEHFYTPEADFKWYSLKTTHELVSERNRPTDLEVGFYYAIGFGLPTAFSLSDGSYQVAVAVTNVGDMANINAAEISHTAYHATRGHFAPLLTDSTRTSQAPINLTNPVSVLNTQPGFHYVCHYNVRNEVFGYECVYDNGGNLVTDSPIHCDPHDRNRTSDGGVVEIDVVYRLISLITSGEPDQLEIAFPGRRGGGRDRGFNWIENPDGSDVDVGAILNRNRRERDPIYVITLDVGTIGTIRTDNERLFRANVDPYSSFCDNGSCSEMKILCEGESTDETYCASEFLSMMYGQGLRGTCIDPWGSNTLSRALGGKSCNITP